MRAEGVAQLVECLPAMSKALSSIPLHKLGMVTQNYNLSTHDMEARGSRTSLVMQQVSVQPAITETQSPKKMDKFNNKEMVRLITLVSQNQSCAGQFLVSLTQSRIIWEEGTLTEKKISCIRLVCRQACGGIYLTND